MIVRLLGALLVVVMAMGAWLYWMMQPPTPEKAPARGGTFSNVTLIQPGESRRPGQTISFDGDRIGAIDATSGAKGPYDGMFVLPGLINMHAHHPPQAIPVAHDLFPLLFLMHGVTTVRDAGDVDGKTVSPLRDQIRQGRFPGPRIFACGPFVDGPQTTWENTRVVTDPAKAAEVVHSIKTAGYDCVKLYNSLAPDVLAALITAAKAEGMPTIGHVSRYVGYPAGIEDVQHFTGAAFAPNIDPRPFPEVMDAWASFDDAQMQRTVEAVQKAGTINTPTLVTIAKRANYDNYEEMRTSGEAALLPRYFADVIWNPVLGLQTDNSELSLHRMKVALAAEEKLLHRLFEVGAPLHIGTDTMTAFVVPGADVQDEMKLFAEAGIPLEQVWKIATSGNGKDLANGLGRLDVGAPADFLVFAKDPTVDLANLATLQAVVADGRVYKMADLKSRFERLKAQWSNPVVETIMDQAVRIAMERFKKDKH